MKRNKENNKTTATKTKNAITLPTSQSESAVSGYGSNFRPGGNEHSTQVGIPDDPGGNQVTLDEIAGEIYRFHLRAVQNEAEALRNAWEAGTRLNSAFDQIDYGKWGEFLREKCSGVGQTTVWRYRRLASSFSTVEKLDGLTLSEVYAKLGLTKFEPEPVTEGNATSRICGTASSGKASSPIATVLRDVEKASFKFADPTTLTETEKESVKRLSAKLETVYSTAEKPSILAVSWQDKIEDDPGEWNEDERVLFEDEFARLTEVNEALQALKEHAA